MITKRRIIYVVFGFMAISTGIAVVVYWLYQAKPVPATGGDRHASAIENRQQLTSVAHLYFADKNSLFLIAERRVLRHPEGPTNFSRKIVEALINGPSGGYTRTIPQDTILRAVYITEDGICYVDVSAQIKEYHPGGVQSELLTLYSLITEDGICYVDVSAQIKEYHPGGVQSELLTLYSLVNSLILNIPEIKAVKILIDGNESMTLAGHIDVQDPIKANMLLIR
jgi:spore germination protein GerM